MRFAGCCNISCKRIDAVEHSDDLGASRKGRNLPTSEKQSTLEKIASPLRRGSKKLQQSNAPGPKDLDALACRLAERVRPRLAKTDGGQTYVSQSVPHPELMEALQDEGLDESSAEGALARGRPGEQAQDRGGFSYIRRQLRRHRRREVERTSQERRGRGEVVTGPQRLARARRRVGRRRRR